MASTVLEKTYIAGILGDKVVLTGKASIGGRMRDVRIEFATPFGNKLKFAVDGQDLRVPEKVGSVFTTLRGKGSSKHVIAVDDHVTVTLCWKLSIYGFQSVTGAFRQWYVALVSDDGIVAKYGDLNAKGLQEEWGIQHLPEGPQNLTVTLQEGKVEWVRYEEEPVAIDNRNGETDLQVVEKRSRTVLVQASLEKSSASEASLSTQFKLGDAKTTGGEWTLGGAIKQTLSEKLSEAKQNSKTSETAFTLTCPKGKKYGWTIFHEQKVHRGVYTLLKGGVESSLECSVPFDVRARVQANGEIL